MDSCGKGREDAVRMWVGKASPHPDFSLATRDGFQPRCERIDRQPAAIGIYRHQGSYGEI